MARIRVFPFLWTLLPLLFCLDAHAADTVTIAAVGDIMMGTSWPEEALPPRDGAGIYDNVLESFRGADIFAYLKAATDSDGKYTIRVQKGGAGIGSYTLVLKNLV